jgi:hypothetical protein
VSFKNFRELTKLRTADSRIPKLRSIDAQTVTGAILGFVNGFPRSAEYAKLRYLYATLGFSTRTSIEFFNGVHEIHQVGTIEFLKRSLDWHAPADR